MEPWRDKSKDTYDPMDSISVHNIHDSELGFLTSFDRSAVPPYVPYPSSRQPSAQGREAAGQSPDCWKANYAGPGTARIWLCRYSATSGAFDGWQRIRADGQTVKFQEGKYLVLVQSDDTPNANLASLMHALQSALSKN